MRRAKVTVYDGVVSTRFSVGDDGTGGMELVVSFPRNRLTGFGNHSEAYCAGRLVEQLRHYADWIAHAHGLEVLDPEELARVVELKTGRPL